MRRGENAGGLKRKKERRGKEKERKQKGETGKKKVKHKMKRNG